MICPDWQPLNDALRSAPTTTADPAADKEEGVHDGKGNEGGNDQDEEGVEEGRSCHGGGCEDEP